MKKHFFPLILATLAFLCVFQQSACAEKYPFRNYSVDDGLPSSFVHSILQDRNGYLWFGTQAGACKFDGITFTTYTIEDGLVSNWVNTIIEDKKGNLWFGTNAGVSKFDRENWITYTTEDGLANNTPYSMLEDSQGNLWIGTWGGGVSRFDGANWKTFTTEDGLADNIVRSIFEDSKGNLWFSLENEGASSFDGKNWTSFPPGDGVPMHAKAILEDRQGNFWIAGYFSGMGLGVAKIAGRPGSGDYTVFSSKDGLTIGFNSSFMEDSQGNIWLGSEYGLVRFDSENWQVYTMENGLNSNYITSMIEDREGNLWFTNTGGGACRLSGTAFTTFTTADGLPNNSLDVYLEDAEGNIWFTDLGTDDGVTRYDGEKWTIYTAEDGLGGNRLRGKLKDSKGNLWFACGGGGLSKFDGEKCKTYTAKDWGGEGLTTWAREIHLEDKKGNIWFNAGGLLSLIKFDGKNWINFTREKGITDVVLSMIEDKNGNLWFRTNDGVTKYDGKNLSNYSTEEGRVLDGEGKIFEDKKGNLWLITPKGLTFFDGENWKTYTTEDGLAGNELLAIHEDVSGNLWLGTNGGGISKYDGSQFTSFTTEHGLSSNVCKFIIEHDSYLYFGTPTGLNRFDGETFKVYTSSDGLAATDIFTSFKDSKGNLWFGSENGVTRFDPSLDRLNLVPPPVYITRLRIFDKDTTVTSGLELGYQENNLRIDYVGISLTAPEYVVYNYKLEGLNEDWLETTEHSMSYPYLPPGEYTFKVKARNRDGVWSEKTAELDFVILPPFWATAWFRGLIMALVLSALLGIYAVRTRAMKRKNIELEEKVRERTLRINGILQSVADGLIVTDKLHNVSLMNKAAQDLLGVRLSEVVNRPIDFTIEEQTLRDRIRSTLENKPDGYQFDFELPAKDPDHPRIMRARTSTIRDEKGEQIGIVTIIQDVTQEREVDRMKTEFLSTAAHELRTPLTSIQGFSEILSTRQDITPQEQNKYLSYINTQSVGLAHIINDLLDISRIESGAGFSLDMTSCDVSMLLRDILLPFQEQSSKHRFELILPEEPIKVTVDKDKIGQVMKNIISNAVKYSPAGGLIKITGELANDHFQLAVEDQGIGMTQEQVEKVFEKFYRVDASNTAVEGTGLGMTIIKYLVEAHGGKVSVDSEYGKGTTVKFSIPLKQ